MNKSEAMIVGDYAKKMDVLIVHQCLFFGSSILVFSGDCTLLELIKEISVNSERRTR